MTGRAKPSSRDKFPGMPELPDITVYVEAIRARVVGQPLETVLIQTPFLLRTVEPKLDVFIGQAGANGRAAGKAYRHGVRR